MIVSDCIGSTTVPSAAATAAGIAWSLPPRGPGPGLRVPGGAVLTEPRLGILPTCDPVFVKHLSHSSEPSRSLEPQPQPG